MSVKKKSHSKNIALRGDMDGFLLCMGERIVLVMDFVVLAGKFSFIKVEFYKRWINRKTKPHKLPH